MKRRVHAKRTTKKPPGKAKRTTKKRPGKVKPKSNPRPKAPPLTKDQIEEALDSFNRFSGDTFQRPIEFTEFSQTSDGYGISFTIEGEERYVSVKWKKAGFTELGLLDPGLTMALVSEVGDVEDEYGI